MLIKKFFIAFLMFFSVAVYAENTWIVKDVQFKGLRNFSQNEALKNITFNMGNYVSQNDIKKSIQSLFKTGKFEDIEVVYSGYTIIFNIKEKPIISNVSVLGNNIINSSMLDKYLVKLNIKKGSSFDNFSNDIFIKTVKNFYYDIGRYQPDIKILKVNSGNNSIELKILINEGILKKINSIKIFGIKDFSEEKILSLFQSKYHYSWWNLSDKSFYSPQKLNQDLERLNNFYLNRGYFYFNINNKKIDFLKDQNNVNITINISEGKKYRISNFFINGNLLSYEKSISDLIKINPYELYNKEKISLIVSDIRRFLSEHGYINAQITVDPIIDNNKSTIVLNFNIDIQKRFFVNRIYFTGNKLTQDKVLRRKIKQIEGRYFNINLVELGKKSLEKTKYFSDVKIIKNVVSYESNKVNVTYQVKEQPTGSINFGLGYGIDSGITFNSSFSQENIFGSGNSLKASIVKNNNQKYADISMSYPYFISDKTDLNTRFFYNDLKYNLNSISNLTKKTYGFEGDLGFLLNDTNKINLGFGYTHNGINNTENKLNTSLIKKSFDKIPLQNSIVNDFTINYSWMYDSLENFYFPISGNQTYISGKNTIPGSDNNFYKITLDSEQYIPLNQAKNFIFLSHIHMGIGNSFNKEKFPFYENFYASSVNNVRGFHVNTIGPKAIYDSSNLNNCIGYKNKNKNVCESIDSIGGNTTFTTNLELIIPIPFIKHNTYSQVLRTSFFIDAGNIWDIKWDESKKLTSLKSLENSLNNIYSSFGLSFQWFSPIGPLVFSYAFPIQKHENYQLEPFQFNIGKNW